MDTKKKKEELQKNFDVLKAEIDELIRSRTQINQQLADRQALILKMQGQWELIEEMEKTEASPQSEIPKEGG